MLTNCLLDTFYLFVGTKDDGSTQFTHTDLDRMKVKRKFTGNQIIGVAADLRAKGGRGIIEPHYKEHLARRRDFIADYFKKEIIVMSEGKMPAVGTTDLKAYADFVRQHRGISEENVGYKVGTDAGMGRLMTDLCVYDTTDIIAQKKKRVCRVEEIQPKDASFLGPCKSQIIHTAPKLKDKYENLRPIYQKLQIERLPRVTIHGDCLYFNEVFGLMSCSSTHPCYGCYVSIFSIL